MKEFRNEVWQLMAKNIANEASDSERLSFDYLLNENEEMKKVYKQLLIYYRTNEDVETKSARDAFKKITTRIKTTNSLL